MSEATAERILNWLQHKAEQDDEECSTQAQIEKAIQRTGIKTDLDTLTQNGHLEHYVAEGRDVWRWIGLQS